MTPFEWILLGYMILLPIGGAAWRVWGRDSVENKELRDFVDLAVREAEEIGARDNLNASAKFNRAFELVYKTYPKLAQNKEHIEALIHAALNSSGFGASGKK